ncbi:putative disease resistance protein At4g10780 [Dioscorea cayenensis subsp. rotundata]|uniref:Disease resistance protein At4g10780 n=1 Tax=Dioscorea cayennensis subsp. rotundata TaxID=55577 RepID=A0AB40AW16_DIOCR|nr:putative disease resistance protein At4g10780 [Dioscorea cayenensis subsp. rotundata]
MVVLVVGLYTRRSRDAAAASTRERIPTWFLLWWDCVCPGCRLYASRSYGTCSRIRRSSQPWPYAAALLGDTRLNLLLILRIVSVFDADLVDAVRPRVEDFVEKRVGGLFSVMRIITMSFSTTDIGRADGVVKEIQRIVNQLKVAYDKRGYLLGSCSLNLWANYKISQSSIKLYKKINNLKAEHDAFKEIEETQPPRAVLEIATSVTLVGNTIKLNLEKVRGYLVNDDVSMVGIWGMGGVGKTTLLNEINNSLLGGDTNPGFNYVISLEVSKEPQFEKLQNEISKRLGLPSDSRKSDIFEFLKKKNFLLLLDDIWKRVDLPEVFGIPLSLRQSQNSENGGQSYKRKVIFTTRDDEVCAHMNAHKKIKVECMDKEAWHLFKLFANEEIINSNENIKELAMEVMEKCSGLPLALKVIGRATSNMKTPEEWRHMLRSLIKTVIGIDESLFHNLKVSYDNLANDTLRQCFLCCAQWCAGADIEVSDLIEHWIWCGLISDFGNMGEAFDKEYSLIAKLNEACLLEFYDINEYYVKLHDVIRDMALWIVSECGKKKNKWIIGESGDSLRQFSKWEAGNWQETELISFKDTLFGNSLLKFLSDQNIDEKGQVSVAATSPRYPNLQSLFMAGSSDRETGAEVVRNFFPHMPSLTHLNLSGAPIAGLSIEIRALVNLQYLNISHSRIRSLPPELEELKLPELQVLDLYGNTCLEAGDLRILMDRKRIKAISMDVKSVKILRLLKDFPICCPKVKKLPFKSSIVNTKFEHVIIGQELWESLEWEDTTIRSHLNKFLHRGFWNWEGTIIPSHLDKFLNGSTE